MDNASALSTGIAHTHAPLTTYPQSNNNKFFIRSKQRKFMVREMQAIKHVLKRLKAHDWVALFCSDLEVRSDTIWPIFSLPERLKRTGLLHAYQDQKKIIHKLCEQGCG